MGVMHIDILRTVPFNPSAEVRNRKIRCDQRDWTGVRVGSLVAIHEQKDVRTFSRHARVWFCRCDCGNTINISSNEFQMRRSCGCRRNQSGPRNLSWTGCGEIPGQYFAQLRQTANARAVGFYITIEFLWDLFLKQNRRCALSGIELHFGDVTMANTRRRVDKTASVDRIDSSLDYTPDNVQWVHKRLNHIKRDLTMNQFVEWCHKVSDYHRDMSSQPKT